ncbi:IMPACT family member YigZ [Corynebacterium kalinowskii]|uniref:IMPACT family member YigZ n=1 Tax=Corynebacterium kalinowskii TaxID=2675216 RepID=A0A6B8W4M3_9CORY|nr:IMPACT family member YigZ [Corynebacterium kalinowskii]
MIDNIYRRPIAGEIFTSELDIKRSTFLGFVTRATDEASAREFVASLKRQYPDARHHCSAFIYHVDDANPIERSNDDGEPSGTAGLPMLDVLRGSGLLDIVAVSVRYFGGIKLGTGGLVRAYSESVTSALASVRCVDRARRELYLVSLDHSIAGRIEADLRGRGFSVVDTAYGARVDMTVGLEPGQRGRLDAFLAEATQGLIDAKLIGTEWIEVHC